jgi:hypothetical protein
MATVNKDFRVKHGLVVEGTNATVDGSDIITEDALTGGTQTNITVTYNPTTKVVDFVSENGVADSTTDDLEEGEDNLYFTDTRAVDAVETAATSANTADKIVKRDSSGNFAAEAITAKVLRNSSAGIFDGNVYLGDNSSFDNYIATHGYVADEIEDHSDLTTGVHGVTGNVVGTTDTQDLSNKRIIDTLYFTDGVTIADEGQIAVKPTTHEFEIKANYGNLDLKTVATDADVNITSQDGDIILNADGNVYKDSVSTENEIITQGRLDSYLGDNTIDGTGGNTVTDRIATAVSDLVDSAPELLDTLNELAAALGDDASFATTIGTEIGTKVSKAGDTMTGALAMGTNKITGLGTPTDDYDAATKKYTDDTFVTLDDLPGQLDDYVPLTQKAAADGVATLDEAAQVPLIQLENVTDIIDALTTADVAEDSGSLYFTDTRAVDALEAVVPNFTAVDINNVAKEVAVSGIPTAGSPTAVLSWDSDTFPSLKAIVMFRTSTHTEISEILLTMDSSNNFAITEYAVVGTNGTLGSIAPEYYGTGSGSALKATTINAGTTVTIKATLLNPYTTA